MLTPILEKLILCGDAVSGTFTAGGSAAQNLIVPNDRFIVIHKMIHFPYIPVEDTTDLDALQQGLITQMQVFSEKSFNSFVFRNNVGVDMAFNNGAFPLFVNQIRTGAPTDIDCYLVHESDVAFNFSKGIAPATFTIGIKPGKAPARKPEFGYGKIGINTAIGNTPVELNKRVFNAEFRPMGRITPPTLGLPESYGELQYPIINGVSNLLPTEVDFVTGFPIVLVQYVSIKGNPNDLMSNL